MDELAGPLAIAALVVAVGGVTKLTAPAATTTALRGVGLPLGDNASRALGATELVVGVAVLAIGGPATAVLLGLTYLGFAGFVEVAMRRGRGGCGCFGSTDAPPTRLHTVVDLTAAGVAFAAALTGSAPFDEIMADQPWAGVPFAGFVVLGAALVTAVLTLLPAALTAPRPIVADFAVESAP